MINLESLKENFKFLVLEVTKQVRMTKKILEDPQKERVEILLNREDYIDNLKAIIENKCFSRIHSQNEPQHASNRVRSIHIICVNLEQIADYCVNIVRQIKHFNDPKFIQRFDYQSMFELIQGGLESILPVQRSQRVAEALDICKIEFELDKDYKQHFDRIQKELRRKNGQVGDLITALFIFRYLERIGDSLLNIGEAFIFAFLGEKIKIHQFQALQETLIQAGYDASLAEIDFKSIWGGRSGCRIQHVKDSNLEPAKEVIFKEGKKEKIRRERDNIRAWTAIFPGITPRIIGYNQGREYASLLVEFLPGCTLDEVILTASADHVQNAMFVLEQTLADVWETTLDPEDHPRPGFIRQILSRLDSIQQVHPGLLFPPRGLGALSLPSFKGLLDQGTALEAQVKAPFSVRLHGDCNLNNIVYDFEEQRIRFIDLYRSRQSDYVQDVSVFLSSNFRLPVFEPQLRERLNWSIHHFYHFASEEAARHQDKNFAFRLALGVCRSLLTSTRFELDVQFANELSERGIYLLERLLEHGDKWQQDFVFPEFVLYY